METNDRPESSFADLVPLIQSADLTPVQKRDQASAVRTVARLLGAELRDVPTDPLELRRRLRSVSPRSHEISRGRWNNIRSLLNKALAHVRTIQPSRCLEPISAEWEALLNGLPFNRGVRLQALIRQLSSKGISPSSVSLSDLEVYRDAIYNDRLRIKPELTWDSIIWSWNICVREIAGWPEVPILRVTRRDDYTLPWSKFPASLKTDVDAFLLRLSGKDLHEDGPARGARQSTLKTREHQLRAAATALVSKGVRPMDVRSLADVTTIDNFKLVLQFFLDRHGNKTSPQVSQMASFLTGVAAHWAKLPDAELLKMKRIASRVSIRRQGMTSKNRERLRPLDDHEAVKRYLLIPVQIRADLESDPREPKLKSVDAQTAVAISILQVAPIRLSNLTIIDLNIHIVQRNSKIYLVFDGSETKNGEPIDFELPHSVVDMIAWYAREFRRYLVRAPNSALFPGAGAGPKSSHLLSDQIKRAVTRYTGMQFHTHLFRHAAGKIFLDQRPGQYEVVSRILGHRSIETTTSIYTGAETRSAGNHYAAVIEELRDAAAPDRNPSSQARRGLK